MSLVEGQAVRAAVIVALLTVCLGLTGCSLFGKKKVAHNTNPKPFLGSETPTKTETVAIPPSTAGPLPGANGTIAGQVLAESTGRPIQAYIRVEDLEDKEGKAAKLDVESNKAGFFTIIGLKAGGHYKLTARAKEGDKLISQVAHVQPPKVTLVLQLSEQWTTPRTPPIPGAPTMPDKATPRDRESSSERTPAARIGPPSRLPEQDPPPQADLAAPAPAAGPEASPEGGNAPDPANIANDFQRIRPSVPVDIPNKPWPPPPPGGPRWRRVPEKSQPRTDPVAPRPPGSVSLPNLDTPVPSCGLYGNRLDNFALYDLEGKVWEYKRDRRGRLTLLDFWYHNCGPCLQCIHHLAALQRDYGPYGLEVIGIACEEGTLEEQRSHVRATRGRYGINYRILLSGGGGTGKRPVMEQFQVEYFPLLVLIDGDGKILWRSPHKGMDRYAHYALKKMIHHRLVMRRSLP